MSIIVSLVLKNNILFFCSIVILPINIGGYLRSLYQATGKFDLYSKYQDFSDEILPSVPDDTDYKYKVAHLTIRAVKDYAELEKVQNKLPNNELI
jgi:hypothetical protein